MIFSWVILYLFQVYYTDVRPCFVCPLFLYQCKGCRVLLKDPIILHQTSASPQSLSPLHLQHTSSRAGMSKTQPKVQNQSMEPCNPALVLPFLLWWTILVCSAQGVCCWQCFLGLSPGLYHPQCPLRPASQPAQASTLCAESCGFAGPKEFDTPALRSTMYATLSLPLRPWTRVIGFLAYICLWTLKSCGLHGYYRAAHEHQSCGLL